MRTSRLSTLSAINLQPFDRSSSFSKFIATNFAVVSLSLLIFETSAAPFLISISVKINLAPIEANIPENAIPMGPVAPVMRTVLFLKDLADSRFILNTPFELFWPSIVLLKD